jgi:ABC-type nitrate/sulfonate/bicarbonate transport system substrate-binding protein
MAATITRRDALAALAGSLAFATGPKAHAAETLRVGKAVMQNPGYIPLDVGMKYGFFAKEGLQIDEINFGGGGKLAQGVAAGAVDIALAGGPDMAFVAKGAPEIAVASITSSPAFMGIFVGAHSTARGIDDLRGKKIGVTSPGSLTYWLVGELDRVKGWTSESDRAVPIVVGGSSTAEFAALKMGEVDAGVGAIGESFQLEEEHAGRLLVNVSEYVKQLELFTTFATTDLIRRNPDAVRRFLKAWYQSVAYMKSHRAETMQVLSETIGYSPAVAQRSYDSLISHFSTDGKFEPAALETLSASFADLKLLDKSADLSKFYTEKFLP